MDTLSVQTIIATLAVFTFSTFVRSVFGFGDALIAMPLLAMVLGLKTATPLVALIAFTIGVVILSSNYRLLKVATAKRLILSTLAGIPFGIFMLKSVDERYTQIALALVLFTFSSYSLVGRRTLSLRSEKGSYPFGFIAGLLGGAYNTNGPPVVIYGSLRGWAPSEFRATLQGYFVTTGLMIIGAHGVGGLWNERVLTLYGLSLPLVIGAIFGGSRVHRRISPDRFRKAIHVLLMLIASMLFFRSFGV